MNLQDLFSIKSPLPATLPQDPLPLFVQWFEHAREASGLPNPDSMSLATTDDQGNPDTRIVLCKKIEPQTGCLIFHTNYHSTKGFQLDHNPNLAIVFHWDALAQQVRVRGRATKLLAQESDAYFQTRHWTRRLGAWASHQSQPLANRMQLLKQIVAEGAKHKVNPLSPENARIPRPPHWGGYRVWASEIELWAAGSGRIHDRARWTRTLRPHADNTSFDATKWVSTRLQP